MDEIYRSLARKVMSGDISALPTLAMAYGRSHPYAPIRLWLVSCEYPHKTVNSIHATEDGAWNRVAEYLETVAQELNDEDGEQIRKALAAEHPFDSPQWASPGHIQHAYTLYQHIIRDWGGEHVGEIYISIEREELEP